MLNIGNYMKKNKILVLGGSSDIGLSLIKLLLDDNWLVTAHYNNNAKKLKLLRKRYKNLELVRLNFRKINSQNCAKIINKNFVGKYDSFTNLIGYLDNKTFYNTDLKNLIDSIKINSLISIIILQKIVKNMLKNKWGRILNCSSIGVKFGGGKNTFNYSLSKHCLEFIPNSYKDWASSNVLINNLRIGVTSTKLHKRILKRNLKERTKLIPMKRMAKPQEIASYIFSLISEQNTYITGQTLSISGGE